MEVKTTTIGFAGTQGSAGNPTRNSIHVMVDLELEGELFVGHFNYNRHTGQLNLTPFFTNNGRHWYFLDAVQHAVLFAEKAARTAAQNYRDRLGTGIPIAL